MCVYCELVFTLDYFATSSAVNNPAVDMCRLCGRGVYLFSDLGAVVVVARGYPNYDLSLLQLCTKTYSLSVCVSLSLSLSLSTHVYSVAYTPRYVLWSQAFSR